MSFLQNPEIQAKLFRLRVEAVGLWHDFWRDEPFPWERWGLGRLPTSTDAESPRPKVPKNKNIDEKASETGEDATDAEAGQLWSTDRIGVIEQLWGEGHHLPGNDRYIDNLVKPLGLNREMSVLDLHAGLGGLGRKLAKDCGCYVNGFEPDQTLATRGMVMSLAAGKGKHATVAIYDPVGYASDRKYDCVFVRELFYRIIGKEKFFQAVAGSVKPGGGQIVFTDYVMDPSIKDKPAIKAWLKREKDAAPLSSIEMIKDWKALGFDLRIAEDQTELYKKEIIKALSTFIAFLSKNTPDQPTKILLVREVDLWLKRWAAMEQGMKYYRFFGIKH